MTDEVELNETKSKAKLLSVQMSSASEAQQFYEKPGRASEKTLVAGTSSMLRSQQKKVMSVALSSATRGAMYKLAEDEPHDLAEENDLKIDYASGDPKRPYQFVDTAGNKYLYYAAPMSVVFSILLLEMCERLGYYTLQPEWPRYLTNPEFAEMDQADASALIAMSNSLMYVWPLVGGIVGDVCTGKFWGIVLFSVFYLISLIMIAVMGFPTLFQSWMPQVVLVGLYPLGVGGVKSLISVMGADQFHPVVHENEVSNYYMQFYMIINFGGAVSTGLNAYANTVGDEMWKVFIWPPAMYVAGLICMFAMSCYYVKRKPLGSATLEVVKVSGKALTTCPPSLEKQKLSNGGTTEDSFVVDTWKIIFLIPFLFMGAVPFNTAYQFMTTYMIFQGEEMAPTWGIESNVLNSAVNPISILLFGTLLDRCIFPWLRTKNLEPSTYTRMVIGSLLGVLAMVYQAVMESVIKSQWSSDRSQDLSIMWQIPAYALIGLGELFVNPATYDLAYKIAPQSLKVTASAISLLMVGFFPNVIMGLLAAATSRWQVDDMGCASRYPTDCNTTFVDPATDEPIWNYPETNMQNLYWVAAGIAGAGVLLNQFVAKPLSSKAFS